MLTYLTPLYIIKSLGVPGILLAIFLENSIVIGGILPGDALMSLVGLALAQGKIIKLGVPLLMLLIWIAGVVGSIVGYGIGYYIKEKVNLEKTTRWYSPKVLHAVQAYFKKHGAIAIILSKFTPYIRAALPMISGIIGFPFRKFVIDTCIGMALRIVILLGGSYLVGQSFPSVKNHLELISFGILLIASIPFIIQIVTFVRKK